MNVALVERVAVAERRRAEDLEGLMDLLRTLQDSEVDRQRFGELFGLAVRTLELDQESLARRFKISRTTISRWEAGKSAPHRLGRKPVFQLLKKITAEKLRQHG